MTNYDEYKNNSKYNELSTDVKDVVEKLNRILRDKDYLYKGVWRGEEEPGGNVFIFEVERRKGRRKNLITLRPQTSFLTVEVYWNKTDKHYFNIHTEEDISDELLNEINSMYQIVAL